MNTDRTFATGLPFSCLAESRSSRAFLLLMTFALGLAVCPLEPAWSHDKSQTPNIVLIVADDLGYAELGCYGQKWIKTPHLDQLAEQGMLFTQHYSGNAVCAPSRCCLMTGRHPGHAETRNNGDPQFDPSLKEAMGWEFAGQNPLTDAEVTIAEMLKQKDYATAAIGKWGLGHFGTTGDPNLQGFDLFYGFNSQRHAHNHYPVFLWRNRVKEQLPGNDATLYGQTYSQDRFRKVALEFIDQHHDRPFFLYLPFAIPHLSIQVPEGSLVEYRGIIPEEEYVHKGYLQHPFPRAGYAAMISHMDRDIGQILLKLDEHKLRDNTIVLFTSDNGPTYDRLGGSDSTFFRSAGPFRGLKGSLYEGGIRVPFIARWPNNIAPGTTSDHLSAFWDIMPILGELTGTRVPEGLDGISFAPTLVGESQRQMPRDFLYWEFPAYGGQQALRMGNWKLVRQNLSKPNVDSPDELYHLASDPGETQNLAEVFPERVARMRQIMREQRTPSTVFPFPALDNE